MALPYTNQSFSLNLLKCVFQLPLSTVSRCSCLQSTCQLSDLIGPTFYSYLIIVFKKSTNQIYFRDNPILNDLDIIFIGICKSLNMLTHTPLLTESPEEFRMNHEIDLTPSYNVV